MDSSEPKSVMDFLSAEAGVEPTTTFSSTIYIEIYMFSVNKTLKWAYDITKKDAVHTSYNNTVNILHTIEQRSELDRISSSCTIKLIETKWSEEFKTSTNIDILL